MWEVDNYLRFCEYYWYRTSCSAIFVDMLDKAEKVIASGGSGADLRFGHDHCLMTLLMIATWTISGTSRRLLRSCRNTTRPTVPRWPATSSSSSTAHAARGPSLSSVFSSMARMPLLETLRTRNQSITPGLTCVTTSAPALQCFFNPAS